MLLALLVCLGHHFFVENPANSIIGLFPRLQWLLRVLAEHGIPATCLENLSCNPAQYGLMMGRADRCSLGIPSEVLDEALGTCQPKAFCYVVDVTFDQTAFPGKPDWQPKTQHLQVCSGLCGQTRA